MLLQQPVPSDWKLVPPLDEAELDGHIVVSSGRPLHPAATHKGN